MKTSKPKNALLSPREMAVWHALKTLSEGALSVVGREIEAATALSGADFAVLSRLEDLGSGALSQNALLRSLTWQKSRLSHQLTRMEERGLVRRVRSEGEREVTIRLLAEGRRAIAAARPVHAEAIRAHVLARVEPAEQELLIRLAERWST